MIALLHMFRELKPNLLGLPSSKARQDPPTDTCPGGQGFAGESDGSFITLAFVPMESTQQRKTTIMNRHNDLIHILTFYSISMIRQFDFVFLLIFFFTCNVSKFK